MVPFHGHPHAVSLPKSGPAKLPGSGSRTQGSLPRWALVRNWWTTKIPAVTQVVGRCGLRIGDSKEDAMQIARAKANSYNLHGGKDTAKVRQPWRPCAFA